ncbi:hypothetical protein PN836_005860 [Ningiella sp. W23]|uniref:hypothetical protein n=1 Tax=Ningiella sp. W23 TaxID=3023715 RepID=UPI003757F31D
MMTVSGLCKKSNGEFEYLLSTPRGLISYLLMVISGAASAVFVPLSMFAFFTQENAPNDFAITALICLLLFSVVLSDRIMSRKNGARIRFFSSNAGMKFELISQNKKKIKTGLVEADTFKISPLKQHGKVGKLVTPTLSMFLEVGEHLPPYTIEISGRIMISLLNAATPEALEAKSVKFCEAIGIDYETSVAVLS